MKAIEENQRRKNTTFKPPGLPDFENGADTIVPTHPDRCGGLGFLAPIPAMFAAVVLAISSVLAAGWGHDVVYHEVAVKALRPQMIAFIAVMLFVFLSPLLAFQSPLRRAKKQALLDYGVLVGRHGRLVHQRWVEDKTLVDDAVLNAPELGPVADTAAPYGLVTKMRSSRSVPNR